MKLRYQKPKGQRIKSSRFYGLSVPGYAYSYDDRRWHASTDISGYWTTLRACNSVKAFRRHLRRNPELRNKATLIHQYVGFAVKG